MSQLQRSLSQLVNEIRIFAESAESHVAIVVCQPADLVRLVIMIDGGIARPHHRPSAKPAPTALLD